MNSDELLDARAALTAVIDQFEAAANAAIDRFAKGDAALAAMAKAALADGDHERVIELLRGEGGAWLNGPETMVVDLRLTAENAAALGDRALTEARHLNRGATVALRDAQLAQDGGLLSQAERRRRDAHDFATKAEWWSNIAEACKKALR